MRKETIAAVDPVLDDVKKQAADYAARHTRHEIETKICRGALTI
jgi:hypothetical protein